jgi:hypothetical protein
MRIILVVALLLCSNDALAFSKTGHQIICTLAYQLSSAPLQAKLDTLSAHSGYDDFTAACSWADKVREQKAFRWSEPLHYINFPRDTLAVSWQHCPEQGCILSGIVTMQQRLQADSSDWQALLFLAHFIGDLHQPLHVSYADDLGGNRSAVYFFGMPTNLHGVWDFALIKQAGYEQMPEHWPTLFAKLTVAQQVTWQQGDILSWANESAGLTKAIYQQYRPGMLLAETEFARDVPLLEQRLLQSGVRLALMLETLLGEAK